MSRSSCPARSEAVEVAAQDPNAKYALGSVLNHVLLHQTVIGEEALQQLALVGETPDLLVGCTGGGRCAHGLRSSAICVMHDGEQRHSCYKANGRRLLCWLSLCLPVCVAVLLRLRRCVRLTW